MHRAPPSSGRFRLGRHVWAVFPAFVALAQLNAIEMTSIADENEPVHRQERSERNSSRTQMEADLVSLTNLEREARGISPLEHVSALSLVARKHSERMAKAGVVSHDLSPKDMEARIRDALPNSCLFGENLAKNTTLIYAVSDLMESEGHRANLLFADFTQIGVGIAIGDDGALYITQNFAKACEAKK